jgi:hypothetical protein
VAQKNNVKDAVVDIVKSLETVFKKYSRHTRTKAWDKLTGKQGDREMRKILNDPSRPVNTFQKLVEEKGFMGFSKWMESKKRRLGN